MGNLLCKQALETHNQPHHFIQCKHQRETVEAAVVCTTAVLHLFSCCKRRTMRGFIVDVTDVCSDVAVHFHSCVLKSSECLLLKNVFIKAHLHLFEQVRSYVCVCVRAHSCACVAPLCVHHSEGNPSATFPILLNFSKNLSNPAEEQQFSHSDIP